MMPELTPDIPLKKDEKKNEKKKIRILEQSLRPGKNRKKSRYLSPLAYNKQGLKIRCHLHLSLSLSLITDLVSSLLYALIDYFGAD